MTEIVGKSTCGSGATGSIRKAKKPASATPSVSSVVATGRAMKGAERLKGAAPPGCGCPFGPLSRRASASKAR